MGLHQLQCADGVVVLRGFGQTVWDKDQHLLVQDLWAEICEAVDSRPTFIINVAKGDVRSSMMILSALADVSLAEPSATFGLPEVRLGAVPAVAAQCLRRRVGDGDLKSMLSTGEAVDAREAQRIGLVDFVGDVEAEVARLLLRHCRPRTTYSMYRPDVEQARKAQHSLAA